MSADPHPPRAWTCPQGHVLGTVEQDASRVYFLIEFERAVAMVQQGAVRPGRVYQKLGCVCSICGSERDFRMDTTHRMDDLLKRRRARTFGLEE